MSINTREAFLNAGYAKPEKIHVEGWGELWIRLASYADTADFVNASDTDRLAINIISSVCDENGKLLLTRGDVEAIKQKPLKTLVALSNEINRINSLDKSAEEISKN